MDPQIISYRIRSAKHKISVRVEEHGAYNEGVENVIFRPNRSLNGHDYFISSNGRAFLTEDQELIVLKDAALFVVIRLHDHAVFHMEPPSPWLFGRVWVEANAIHADLYQFDDFSKSDKIEPIALTAIEDELVSGWGPASEGLFPTANPNFVNFYRRYK